MPDPPKSGYFADLLSIRYIYIPLSIGMNPISIRLFSNFLNYDFQQI